MNNSLNWTIEYDILVSSHFLEISKKINIIASLLVLCIGLLSNCLTIIVFSHSKFRSNSSNIYLLSLAFVDNLFLLTHFFEDTIKTYEEIFITNENITNEFISILNITNRIEISCKLINYLRYILRFISAYVVVVFTLQRLFLIYFPLSVNFKSKKSAWTTLIIIIIISIVLNIWAPFLFKIQTISQLIYCDIITEWKSEYILITNVYVILIVFIPIPIIFISNILIICKTNREESRRKNMQNLNISLTAIDINSRITRISRLPSHLYTSTNESIRGKQSVLRRAQNNRTTNSSKKIATTLMIVSFSFAVLNLPYLCVWSAYNLSEYKTNHMYQAHDNYLFAFVKIAEIFFVLNYGIKFFIYCATGSIFRQRLYSLVLSSKINFICLFFITNLS
jgi:hypothetical protein